MDLRLETFFLVIGLYLGVIGASRLLNDPTTGLHLFLHEDPTAKIAFAVAFTTEYSMSSMSAMD